MSTQIKLRKGFDIKLAGAAKAQTAQIEQPKTFAIKPADFPGIRKLPKLLAREGDQVKAGTPLFVDKEIDTAHFCSPVSGEVAEIRRGAKRALLEVVILADPESEMKYEDFGKLNASEIASMSKEDVKKRMLEGGVWPNLVQRPFAIMADPESEPKSVFVSGFDTHPLAPDYEYLFEGQQKYLQAGVDVLRKFAKGGVHLGLNGQGGASKAFGQLQNVKTHSFSGPHPAGNVGVHIHQIDPINSGEYVWTVNPYGLAQIGKLFLEGRYDASRTMALVGSEVKQPQYYKTYTGANVSALLKDNLKQDHVRVVSGNVLTGTAIGKDGHVGFFDNMVTVIPEGDRPRFFLTEGWFAPTSSRLSYHRALGLLSFLSPNKERVLDTNTNGEERAFVMTGAFEEVVPMDIYPTHLLKAIMAEDYDEMEALGILEIAEEDFALCEFIDVSKHDVQALVRKGIDMLREG